MPPCLSLAQDDLNGKHNAYRDVKSFAYFVQVTNENRTGAPVLGKIRFVKKRTPRTWTLIFTGIGLLALLLLAISINTLQLAPGQPYSVQGPVNGISPGGMNGLGDYVMLAFRAFMILLWVAVPVYLILALINKDMRKRLLRDIAMLLPVLLLLFYLSNQKPAQRAVQDLNPPMFNGSTMEAGLAGTPAPPPPEFVPPPGWVTTLTTAVIAIVITLIILAVVYGLWRRARNQRSTEPLKQVEREAQAAIDAIGAGGDLREVIMRCYFQMIEALKEYRGIHRSYDMTPHEFELTLQKRGLPAESVHQLTGLFEQVRYGMTKPGRQDEATAIASLSAIVSACQKTRST